MKSFCHWYSSHWVYVCYCCSFLPVACVSLIFPVHLGVVLCDNMMCDSSCSIHCFTVMAMELSAEQ